MGQNIDFYLYRIYVVVRDSQGRRCAQPHIIPVQACQCDSRNYCTSGATRIIIIGGGGGSGGGTGGGTTGGGGGGTGGGGREDGGQQGGGDSGQTRPGGEDFEDHTDWQGYTDSYDGREDAYTDSTDGGYAGNDNIGRQFDSNTTLSGAAIGLMFLGGLIFVCKYEIKRTIFINFLNNVNSTLLNSFKIRLLFQLVVNPLAPIGHLKEKKIVF